MTAAPSQAPILELQELSKSFPVGGSLFGGSRLQVRAVDRVSFTVRQGEVLGLVGESGSGKSTLGRTLLRLMRPTGGRVLFEGTDIADLGRRQLKPIRPRLQFVFQDPAASLNPRMTVGRIVAMPLRVQKDAPAAAERAARVAAALETVGLSAGHAERFPHEFSGGQRQRIGIARALVTEPRLLVADEPVSALDVSVQAQIINLLMEVKRRLDLTIVFISHDLAVVGQICDRVAVMYLGRIIEIAPARALFETPRHPYTEALLSAAPIPDPMLRRPRILLKGELPSPLSPPSGCAFRTRCRYALPACAEIPPPLQAVGEGHLSACIRPELALASPLAPSLIPGTLRSTP